MLDRKSVGHLTTVCNSDSEQRCHSKGFEWTCTLFPSMIIAKAGAGEGDLTFSWISALCHTWYLSFWTAIFWLVTQKVIEGTPSHHTLLFSFGACQNRSYEPYFFVKILFLYSEFISVCHTAYHWTQNYMGFPTVCSLTSESQYRPNGDHLKLSVSRKLVATVFVDIVSSSSHSFGTVARVYHGKLPASW